jgi:hypothetical protein
MRTAAILEIIEGVDSLDADDKSKALFRHLVCMVGVAHGLSRIVRNEQVTFARRLLALRTSRATIRDRLISNYGVSRSQAYNLIGAALSCPEKAH